MDEYKTSQPEDEISLERSYRDRMELLTELAPDAILSTGADQLIRSFNTAAEQMFGYRRDEIIGKHLGLLLLQEEVYLHATDGFG